MIFRLLLWNRPYDELKRCTPLLYCVRKQPQWVPLLLELGADPSLTLKKTERNSSESASDVAWRNKDYEVVFQLIMADGPYPEGFNKKKLSSNQVDKIEDRSKMIQNFHDQIKNNNFDEVGKFLVEHPKEKYAYNLRNKCALLTALEMKNSEMYELLISEGFAVGIEDKMSVNKEIERHLTLPNILVFKLVSKSRLGPNNQKRLFRKVKKYFETLSEIEEIESILQLVAASDGVTIIFDFNNKYVWGIDPANPNKDSKGRTYASRGKIFIAANRESDCELLGTLTHELTHYTMHIIYNNLCLPYHIDDIAKQQNFKTVIEKCEKFKDKQETIAKVFNYDSTQIPAELIVRVPQLMAMYRKEPKILGDCQQNFKDLFEFYEKFVAPDIKAEATLIKPRQKSRDWNKRFGLLERLLMSKMFCKSDTDNLAKINRKKVQPVFVETKTPEMMMASLVSNLRESNKIVVDSENIFVEIQQLDSSYLADMLSLFDSQLKPTVYVLDSNNFDIGKVKIILNELITEAAVVIVTSKSYEDFEETFPGWLPVNVTFKWDDLTDNAKLEIMEYKFVFQEKETIFKKILSKEPGVLSNSTVEEILTFLKSERDTLSERENVFIERRFELITNPSKHFLKAEDVIERLMSHKCVILADLAGMGKSTSAVELARTLIRENDFADLNSGFWVVLIDLKQHTSVYLKDNQYLPIDIEPEFFSVKILKLKSEFERKLFSYFFINSKILFIMDGVDEISPIYKKFVLNMIKLVRESNNRLLVTTRTHLTAELESVLITSPIRFRPFTEQDQVDFLTTFWGQKLSGTLEIKVQLKDKANGLLKKFQETLNRRDFVEVPLQLYMMAEVFGDAEISDDDMNLFLLYKKFVEKKINIWINDKGSLAKNDNTEIQTSEFNVRLMHQKLAIENIFGKAAANSLFPLLIVTLDKEMIFRIGLIKLALNDYFEFVHKTYAEFLIADFCFTKISTTTTQSLGVDIFVKIFVERDYENIRKFINEKLKTEADFLQSAIKWQEVATELSQEKNQAVLSTLVSEKLINLAIFLLNTGTIDKNAKLAFAKHENKYFGNPLQAVSNNFDFFSKLWSSIKNFTDANEQKELLLSGGEAGNILEQVFDDKNYVVLKFVLQTLSEVMTEEEFKELVSQKDRKRAYFIVQAAIRLDDQSLEIFWTIIEEKLKVKNQKLILYSKDAPKGILAELVEYSLELSCLLKTIEKSMNPFEIKSFLKGEDWVVHVLCFFAQHASSECFTTLWNFVEDHFKDKQDRKFFLLKRILSKNVLVQSCCSKDEFTRRAIFAIARELMAPDEFRTELTTAGNNGLLGFHYAFINGKTPAYIDAFEQEFKIKLLPKDVRHLLKMTFPDGKNLTFAFNFCDMSIKDCNSSFKFLVKHLEATEVKEMLLKNDDERGYNALCYALLYPRPFLIEILEWFKLNSNIREMETVFTIKTRQSFTLLHVASYYCEKIDLMEVIKFLVECNFHESVVKSFLSTEDGHQDIPLYVALLNEYFSSTFQVLWNFYNETFDESELKAIISKYKNKILEYRKTSNKEAADLLISLASEKFNDIFDT